MCVYLSAVTLLPISCPTHDCITCSGIFKFLQLVINVYLRSCIDISGKFVSLIMAFMFFCSVLAYELYQIKVGVSYERKRCRYIQTSFGKYLIDTIHLLLYYK